MFAANVSRKWHQGTVRRLQFTVASYAFKVCITHDDARKDIRYYETMDSRLITERMMPSCSPIVDYYYFGGKTHSCITVYFDFIATYAFTKGA